MELIFQIHLDDALKCVRKEETMAKKQFVVVGLGQYGLSVARTLCRMGSEVLAVDRDEEKVQDIANDVTYAVAADATDEEVMENLGVSDMDAAVVALTGNMESSIMATIILKELGVPQVIVKASSEIHKKIALKVGADSVVFPETEMGVRTAKNLTASNFIDLAELSPDFSIIEVAMHDEWVGRSLREVGFREKHGVNVIAINDNGHIEVHLDPNQKLLSHQYLVVIGDNKDLRKLEGRRFL